MKEFSERENKIIKVIKANDGVNVKEIVKKIFKKDELLDAENAIYNSLTRIEKKCKKYKLKWTLLRSRVEGPLTLRIK